MIKHYFTSLRLKLVSMTLVATYLGYHMASQKMGVPVTLRVCITLFACLLAAGGASVLNQVLEREYDGQMDRTRNRPISSGEMHPLAALLYGKTLVLSGVFLLFFEVNLLTSFLVLLIAFLYVLVYTPLKRVSWINTPVGAIPGAIPPMVGWAAVTGEVGLEAWILFGVLFLWQLPHFYAISWIYREDYAKAGYQMLSVVDPSGRRVGRQSVWGALLLLPVSLALGPDRSLFFWGALGIGIYFMYCAFMLNRNVTLSNARTLFRASLIYLPVLLGLAVFDPPGARGTVEVRPPDVFFSAPALEKFELLNQEGKKFEPQALKSKISVANFIFTSCPHQCPLMTRRMVQLQTKFGNKIELVSISVDPTTDRPSVLKSYAQRFSADLKSWHFLTAANDAVVSRILIDGFKLGHGDTPMTHTDRFVLIDRENRIRGFYSMANRPQMNQLDQDIETLLNPPKPN